MKAWLLSSTYDLKSNAWPLQLTEVPIPTPGKGEIVIKISCCGVCHTELDEIEGRTQPPGYPIIPGHQVVGVVVKTDVGASRFKLGDRVGVAWIFSSCGACEYCISGRENLCGNFKATGRDRNGGYAEFMAVNQDFAFKIPDIFSDVEAAPLLCGGAIGYRSLKLSGISDGEALGLSGFGASAHLVLKLVRYLYPNSPVFVFARSAEEQKFALQLGAAWAGTILQTPPHKVNSIIDTTPVWATVTASLIQLKSGGRLVINAISKENGDQKALLDIRYQEHLWMEKEIKTVANITRADVEEFLKIASEIPIRPEVELYSFLEANKALFDLKNKHVRGAKVLTLR